MTIPKRLVHCHYHQRVFVSGRTQGSVDSVEWHVSFVNPIEEFTLAGCTDDDSHAVRAAALRMDEELASLFNVIALEWPQANPTKLAPLVIWSEALPLGKRIVDDLLFQFGFNRVKLLR